MPSSRTPEDPQTEGPPYDATTKIAPRLPSRPQTAASDAHATSNQPLPPQGHVARGAARGAALGAVGGAITGDAGTGAAAGAAMGGLAGGMRRRQQRLQQNQQQQAASQAASNSQASQSNAYHRAMAACLTGR